MSIAPEYAAAWRNLAGDLSANQISALEDLEHDCQTGYITGPGDVPLSDDDSELLLRLARKDVVSNLRAMMLAEVQLPDGAAVADDWEGGDSPQRVILGAERGVAGHRAIVRTAAIQFADGRVDDGRIDEAPSVSVEEADDLSSGQARELAAALLAAADEIDGWAR